MADDTPLWSPDPARIARANLTAFIQQIQEQRPPGAGTVDDFPSLYRWSVERPDAFWPEVWRFCGVIAEERSGRDPWDSVVVGLDRMAPPDPELGPRWFPGARLNYAENLLRHADERAALVFWDERGRQREVSYRELNLQVRSVAAALAAEGVGAGDRVAGFMIYELHKTRLHVLNFSVAPEFRRRRVGSQMIAKLVGKLSSQRVGPPLVPEEYMM